MSDLIKKVHEAIRDAEGGLDKAEARAAIAAVAEWLGEDPDAKQCFVAALVLNEQLEQPKGAAGDGR